MPPLGWRKDSRINSELKTVFVISVLNHSGSIKKINEKWTIERIREEMRKTCPPIEHYAGKFLFDWCRGKFRNADWIIAHDGYDGIFEHPNKVASEMMGYPIHGTAIHIKRPWWKK